MDEFETEQMHYEIDALHAEVERLRCRVDDLERAREHVRSLATTQERAAVAAYLRANTCGCHNFAGDLERGEHRREEKP